MSQRTKERLLFILGAAICFAVAGLSVFIEHLLPGELLGALAVIWCMGLMQKGRTGTCIYITGMAKLFIDLYFFIEIPSNLCYNSDSIS